MSNSRLRPSQSSNSNNSECRTVNFDPPLAASKVQSIEKMGFGLFNKVMLYFPSVFWAKESDYIGLTSDTRGKYYLILSMYQATQQPAMIVYVAGQVAYELEEWTDEEVIADLFVSLQQVSIAKSQTFSHFGLTMACWA